MTPETYQGAVLGAVAVGIAAIAAWLEVRGKESCGLWFIVLCLLISTCSRL